MLISTATTTRAPITVGSTAAPVDQMDNVHCSVCSDILTGHCTNLSMRCLPGEVCELHHSAGKVMTQCEQVRNH